MSFIDDLRSVVRNDNITRNEFAQDLGNKVIEYAMLPYTSPFMQAVQGGYKLGDTIWGDRGKGKISATVSNAGGAEEQEDNSNTEEEHPVWLNITADATKKEDENTESTSSSPDYDVDEMAGEFILGAWGNGQERIDNMISAGYSLDDYNTIQQRVNDAYESGRDLHELTDKANEKLRYW